MTYRSVHTYYDRDVTAREYHMRVPESGGSPQARVAELLGGLVHPEDAGAHDEFLAGLLGRLAPFLERVQQMHAPSGPLGTRWHDGCVEFDTPEDYVIVLPLDQITRIEFGPLQDISDELYRMTMQKHRERR